MARISRMIKQGKEAGLNLRYLSASIRGIRAIRGQSFYHFSASSLRPPGLYSSCHFCSPLPNLAGCWNFNAEKRATQLQLRTFQKNLKIVEIAQAIGTQVLIRSLFDASRRSQANSVYMYGILRVGSGGRAMRHWRKTASAIHIAEPLSPYPHYPPYLPLKTIAGEQWLYLMSRFQKGGWGR